MTAPVGRLVPRVDIAARRVLKAVEALDQAVYDALKDPTEPRDRLVATLAYLDRTGVNARIGASQRLAGVLTVLRGHIGASLPWAQPETFMGIGTLKRRMGGRSYGWPDGRRLAHMIAARAAEQACVDPDTGAEISPIPPAVLAGAVADALIECGGLDNRSASWRSDSLRARGIDPADHREITREGAISCTWEG